MNQNGKRREEKPRIVPLDDEEFRKFDRMLRRSPESEHGSVVDLMFRRLFLTISNLKVERSICHGTFEGVRDGTDKSCPGYWRGRTRQNEVVDGLREEILELKSKLEENP